MCPHCASALTYLYIYNTQYFWIEHYILYDYYDDILLCHLIMYIVPFFSRHILSIRYINVFLYLFCLLYLRTVACHVTRMSLFRMALCCDVHVTIKHFKPL